MKMTDGQDPNKNSAIPQRYANVFALAKRGPLDLPYNAFRAQLSLASGRASEFR